MEDSNDIITPPIIGAGGGIRRTYEDSIIRSFDTETIGIHFKNHKINPIFLEDIQTGRIYFYNVNDKTVVYLYKDAETSETYPMKIVDVVKSDRFKELTVLGIAPLNEKYCLVELIDPKALREHLLEEREMRLERKL